MVQSTLPVRTFWPLCWGMVLLAQTWVWSQVLVRPPAEKSVPELTLSTWRPGLSQAWLWVAGMDAADATQAAEVRELVVGRLMELGNWDQAHASTRALSGLGRYQAFARLAARSKEAQQKMMLEEAERGFEFLSQRNQEQLVKELVELAVPKGWPEIDKWIKRCLDVEERMLALGRAAAVAVSTDEKLSERCLRELEKQLVGLNELQRRYAVLALIEVATAVQKEQAVGGIQSDAGMDWLSIANQAHEVCRQGVVDSGRLNAMLAELFHRGGRADEAAVLYETAWNQLGRQTVGSMERIEWISKLAEVGQIMGNERLSREWFEGVRAETELADVEWKWEHAMEVGRVAMTLGDKEDALQAWKMALALAHEKGNPVLGPVCAALIALECDRWDLPLPAEVVMDDTAVGGRVQSKGGEREF